TLGNRFHAGGSLTARQDTVVPANRRSSWQVRGCMRAQSRFRSACFVQLAIGFILSLPLHTAAQDPAPFKDAGSASANAFSAESRLNGRLDWSARVSLPGNVRPEANPANDLGPVDDGMVLEHMQLLLEPSPQQHKDLESYLDALSDKSSPDYHRWLTAEEFGVRFGVADGDIEQVRQWLESYGFTVNLVYPNRMTLDFTGTAATVRSAFLTEIHAYEADG